MVVDAGGAIETHIGGNLMRGDVLDLFFIFLDHQIFVSQKVVQLFFVVFSQLFLVLQLIFVHFSKFVASGFLLIEVEDESIDALLGVCSTVLALVLVNHVFALHHISQSVHL